MPYANPISDKFQATFNKFAGNKNAYKKELVEKLARAFFKAVLLSVIKEEADHCPFPEYLAESYLKSLKPKSINELKKESGEHILDEEFNKDPY